MQKERKYTQVTAHTLSRCLTQRLQQEEKTKLMSWSLWSSFPFITEAPKALRASNNIFPHTHKSGASFVCINSGSRCLRSFCLSTKRPHTWLITCDVVVVLPLWERRSKPTTDQTEIFHFWICFEYFPQKKKKKHLLTAVFSEWLMEPESYVYIQMVKNRSWGPSAWLWSATLRPHSRAPILPLCVLHTVTCIRYGNRIETLQPWKPLNFLFLYVHRVALTTDWANP